MTKDSLLLRWTRLINTTMIHEVYKENSWGEGGTYLENSAQSE